MEEPAHIPAELLSVSAHRSAFGIRLLRSKTSDENSGKKLGTR
jgi:hypothetical protein